MLEEPAFFSNHETKVSSVNFSGSAPELPVAAGVAAVTTTEEPAAAI